jgi:hypothetical protein
MRCTKISSDDGRQGLPPNGTAGRPRVISDGLSSLTATGDQTRSTARGQRAVVIRTVIGSVS